MGWLERLEAKSHDDNFTPANAVFHGGYAPRSSYNYGRDIRGGLASNVIMSPLSWILRNFTEADAIVQVRRSVGEQLRWEHAEGHELELLMARPNPFYAGGLLWRSSIVSYVLDGNAYWRKIRNRFGEILGYLWLPHFQVEPKWPSDGSVFISHYEYTPFGQRPIDIEVRDIVHFRQDALDPENPRKGLSKLKTLLREVFTDEEAANFSAAILRNMGVPGGVIAPKDASALPSKEDVEQMKQHMKGQFTGDKRGEWLVLGAPTEVAQFGYDPNRLMLTNLRDIPEERVCAAMGVPAAVVGFGAGLQQTKVGATMKELRKEAWDSCIRPMQNQMAEQATLQALPDFQAESHLHRYRVRFDISNFAASQEEEKERVDRLSKAVLSSMLRVDQAQEMAGFEVDPRMAVYLVPSGYTMVKAGEGEDGGEPPLPSDPETGNPQRNGHPPLSRDRIRDIIAQIEAEEGA